MRKSRKIMNKKWRRHVDADAKAIAKRAKEELKTLAKTLKGIAIKLKKEVNDMSTAEKIEKVVFIIASVYSGRAGVKQCIGALKAVPKLMAIAKEAGAGNVSSAINIAIVEAKALAISAGKLLVSYGLAKAAIKG